MEPSVPICARLLNLFQLMEKLLSRVVKRSTTDDLQQFKYTAGKLYHVMTMQDRTQKDMILRDPYNIELLCHMLESRVDKSVTENCLLIIQDLLGRTQIGRRCVILVNSGVTNVLLRLLAEEAKEKEGHQQILIAAHQILAKIGPKDRKFSVKARLNGAMLVTVNLIKTNLNNSKLLLCLLTVLKLYSNNSINAAYLGKHGTVLYLFKVLEVSGKRAVKPLKLILDILASLTKLKGNSSRVIGLGGVQLLLPLYHEWHQLDTRNRQVDLRKSMLVVLKNLTNIDAGRKVFVEHNGIRILYESAQDSVDCKEVESMIILASVIMRKCCPQDTLPVESVDSPVLFKLPASEFHKPLGLAGSYETLSTGRDEASYLPHIKPNVVTRIPSENDAASINEDDALDSEEDRRKNENSDEDDGSKEFASEAPYTRTPQELRAYEIFFPEIFELFASDIDQTISLDNSSASQQSDFYISKASPPNSYMKPTQSSLNKTENAHRGDQSKQSDAESHSSRASSQSDYVPTFLTAIPQKMFEFPRFPEFKSPASDFFYPATVPRPPNAGPSQKVAATNFDRADTTRLNSAKKTTRSSKSGRPATRRLRRSQTDSGFSAEFQESLMISGTQDSAMQDCLSHDSLDSLEQETSQDSGAYLRDPQTYSKKAASTKSVSPFTKLAYPDYSGALSCQQPEPLYHRKLGVQRAKIFEDIQRMIDPEEIYNQVVYDLDSILSRKAAHSANIQNKETHKAKIFEDIQRLIEPNKIISRVAYDLDMLLTKHGNSSGRIQNDDADRVGKPEMDQRCLTFNAQFESGNLRKAIQVRDTEYDLVINPDVNTNHHHQWFYFEVSNVMAGVDYRFNIVNCEKVNSQFNFGMQPVMYSVIEALHGRPYWRRAGTDICYYRNHFSRLVNGPVANDNNNKGYYTATFTLSFPHNRDVCYLAYHYPYTYTTLMTQISNWGKGIENLQIFFHHQTLCTTVTGNDVPLLTITSQPDKNDERSVAEFKARPYIFLSARVHPGESNSSWVMKGSIDFLLSDQPLAQAARDSYIFKIVPMLNPDGVINGNHRCSLTGEDLNRRWLYPCPTLHPTIYHTKGLLMFMNNLGIAPFVYCDYHGHSRRKNVFLYGCAASQSWCAENKNIPACAPKPEENACKALPRLLQQMAPAFSYNNCSFTVEKAKESTARVVVWREIGVTRSYTMESSYCGCDQGPYKDVHISIHELTEMGHKFIEGLTKLELDKVDSAPEIKEIICLPTDALPTVPPILDIQAAMKPTNENYESLSNFELKEHFLNYDVSDYEDTALDKDVDYDYEFDDDDDENSDEYNSDDNFASTSTNQGTSASLSSPKLQMHAESYKTGCDL